LRGGTVAVLTAADDPLGRIDRDVAALIVEKSESTPTAASRAASSSPPPDAPRAWAARVAWDEGDETSQRC